MQGLFHTFTQMPDFRNDVRTWRQSNNEMRDVLTSVTKQNTRAIGAGVLLFGHLAKANIHRSWSFLTLLYIE